MTVAEKIRSLTDEGLACWLTKLCIDYGILLIETNFPSIKINHPTEEQYKKMYNGYLVQFKEEAIIDDERR